MAKIAYMSFHTVILLLLAACVGAWIASYRGGYYNDEVDLCSLHRDGSSTIFYKRFAACVFMRGEAIFQVGKTFWDRAPTVPFPAIHFEGEQVLDVNGFILPEKGWRQFRYETYSEPPDSFSHSLGNSGASFAFPFWSAFLVLSIPFLIWCLRLARRRVLDRKRGFAPILNE